MANISNWLNEVSIKVPGAIKDDIDTTVRSVVREFCSKTLLYVRQLAPFDLIVSQSEYTLVAPTDTSIVGVEKCEINGVPSNPVSEDLLNRTSEASSSLESSSPIDVMVDVEKKLKLRELPTESILDGIVVWVSLKPSPTSDTVPDFIYEDWFDCILNGVLARLFKTPSKTYTNINLGQFYEREYKGEVTRAKGKKITGITKLSLRVQGAPFSIV